MNGGGGGGGGGGVSGGPGGLGERCKFPQRGLGRSPSRQPISCSFASPVYLGDTFYSRYKIIDRNN